MRELVFPKVDAAEAVDADLAGAVEAEVVVQGDGAGVALGDVEEAAQAIGRMEAKEMADETAGVSASGEAGVGADGADLDEARDGEAFAGHGYELAVDLDAEVGAENVSAGAKEAGEGYVGEVDHGGGVFGVELADG